MGFYFEQLDAYKKATAFAKDVLHFTSNPAPKNYALADQLRRAAMSIPANIAEGWGRWHPREKKQFYGIAMGSTNECVPFLEFALDQRMISIEEYNRLNTCLRDISQLINGLVRVVARCNIKPRISPS